MQCPLCFANAGAGFSLTIEEVDEILDGFVATEGYPEVVQFSGGEPTIHPDIVPMLRSAKRRNIRHVMLNTNGKRIANDDAFLAELADIQPAIYLQFRRVRQRDISNHSRRARHSGRKTARTGPSGSNRLQGCPGASD
jgi:uncharacterized radical SAM superfamily Fe-S cluster-containing enzyme